MTNDPRIPDEGVEARLRDAFSAYSDSVEPVPDWVGVADQLDRGRPGWWTVITQNPIWVGAAVATLVAVVVVATSLGGTSPDTSNVDLVNDPDLVDSTPSGPNAAFGITASGQVHRIEVAEDGSITSSMVVDLPAELGDTSLDATWEGFGFAAHPSGETGIAVAWSDMPCDPGSEVFPFGGELLQFAVEGVTPVAVFPVGSGALPTYDPAGVHLASLTSSSGEACDSAAVIQVRDVGGGVVATHSLPVGVLPRQLVWVDTNELLVVLPDDSDLRPEANPDEAWVVTIEDPLTSGPVDMTITPGYATGAVLAADGSGSVIVVEQRVAPELDEPEGDPANADLGELTMSTPSGVVSVIGEEGLSAVTSLSTGDGGRSVWLTATPDRSTDVADSDSDPMPPTDLGSATYLWTGGDAPQLLAHDYVAVAALPRPEIENSTGDAGDVVVLVDVDGRLLEVPFSGPDVALNIEDGREIADLKDWGIEPGAPLSDRGFDAALDVEVSPDGEMVYVGGIVAIDESCPHADQLSEGIWAFPRSGLAEGQRPEYLPVAGEFTVSPDSSAILYVTTATGQRCLGADNPLVVKMASLRDPSADVATASLDVDLPVAGVATDPVVTQLVWLDDGQVAAVVVDATTPESTTATLRVTQNLDGAVFLGDVEYTDLTIHRDGRIARDADGTLLLAVPSSSINTRFDLAAPDDGTIAIWSDPAGVPELYAAAEFSSPVVDFSAGPADSDLVYLVGFDPSQTEPSDGMPETILHSVSRGDTADLPPSLQGVGVAGVTSWSRPSVSPTTTPATTFPAVPASTAPVPDTTMLPEDIDWFDVGGFVYVDGDGQIIQSSVEDWWGPVDTVIGSLPFVSDDIGIGSSMAISPDGKTAWFGLLYSEGGGCESELYEVSLPGPGEPAEDTPELVSAGYLPAVSPDGSTLAYFVLDSSSPAELNCPASLVVEDRETGNTVTYTFGDTFQTQDGYIPRPNALVFVDNDTVVFELGYEEAVLNTLDLNGSGGDFPDTLLEIDPPAGLDFWLLAGSIGNELVLHSGCYADCGTPDTQVVRVDPVTRESTSITVLSPGISGLAPSPNGETLLVGTVSCPVDGSCDFGVELRFVAGERAGLTKSVIDSALTYAWVPDPG